MERDNETYGTGNEYDFGARVYSTRLGRWFSVDKVATYGQSLYCFVSNNPLQYYDYAGMIKRDPKTNQIVLNTDPKYKNWGAAAVRKNLDNGQGFVHALVVPGFIETDRGNKLPVYVVIGYFVEIDEYDEHGTKIGVKEVLSKITRPSQYSANCYGSAFADDMFFIPDRRSVSIILKDEYTLIKEKGKSFDNIKFQKGDVMEFGLDHFIKASGNYNKKGEMIWESHFSMDEKKEGTLVELQKYLANSGEGQEDEFMNINNATLYRKTE